jgi:uncharacterized secreted protein with C-terminal beta-propeller domain
LYNHTIFENFSNFVNDFAFSIVLYLARTRLYQKRRNTMKIKKRKLIALFVTFAMTFSVFSISAGVWADNQPIADEELTIEDALDVLKHLASIEILSEQRAAELDRNSDGQITLEDALIILRVLAGLYGYGDYMELFRLINNFHNEQREQRNEFDGGWAFTDDAAMLPPGAARNVADAQPVSGDMEMVTADEASGDFAGGQGAGAGENHSDTNNQVEGVQESDIVKTDGNYIFVAASSNRSNLRVSVVKPDNGVMELTARISLDNADELHEMLLYDGKLVVVWSKAEYAEVFQPPRMTRPEGVTWDCCCYDGWYWTREVNREAVVEVYDTNLLRTAPEVFNKPVSVYTQQGRFHSARMIDNNIYVITNFTPLLPERLSQNDIHEYIPTFSDNDEYCIVPAGMIRLPENLDSIQYTVIGGLDVNKADMSVSVAANLGSTDTIYASLNNIYITRTQWGINNNWWWGWRGTNESQQNRDPDCTIIDKFAIGSGNVSFTANAKLTGTTRNQFHYDEFEGILRVVTEVWGYAPVESANTTILPIPEDTGWWRERAQWGTALDYDNDWGLQGGVLYTLDENLNVLAQVHRIGFGENVHSVRFMGDRGYVVTFWQTDPLFSFDLSDPANPKLLGELKIPGFSRYLHSWADGLLLGMGVETDDNGIRTGLKMTMFDVLVDDDLIEKHVELIGEQRDTTNWNNWVWTSSPFEHDHRAVLVNSQRNIIGFPYSSSSGNSNTSLYAVYSYQPNSGFRLLGEIKHELIYPTWDWNDSRWQDWSWHDYNIRFERGLFIGDYIYAVAENLIVSARIRTNSITEIHRLSL